MLWGSNCSNKFTGTLRFIRLKASKCYWKVEPAGSTRTKYFLSKSPSKSSIVFDASWQHKTWIFLLCFDFISTCKHISRSRWWITGRIADFDRELVSYCQWSQDESVEVSSWANLKNRMNIIFCQIPEEKKRARRERFSELINR